MSTPVPQMVTDRIFAFMLTEKTGSIELHFKRGQLLTFRVTESVRLRPDDPEAPERSGLDIPAVGAQDSQR
jgi:hypothetical protein